MKPKEAAHSYLDRGYCPFPLLRNSKKPGKPWLDYAKQMTTHDKIEAEFTDDCNIAIACGHAGLYVADADDAGAIHFVQQNFPPTVCQATPRGGRHFLFRTLTEERNRGGIMSMKLDSRGSGGYIVAYPSMIDGKQYQWLGKLPHVMELPVIDVKAILGEPEQPDAKGIVHKGDARAAWSYISKLFALEGERDNKAFKVACVLVQSFALPLEMARELIFKWDAQCCTPPIGDEKILSRKVVEAARLYGSQRERIEPTMQAKSGMVSIKELRLAVCILCGPAKGEKLCYDCEFTDQTLRGAVCLRHFNLAMKVRSNHVLNGTEAKGASDETAQDR